MTSLPLNGVPTRVLVLAAVGLLLCGAAINVLLLKPHNELPARGTTSLPIPNLGGGPIVQLELARSENDIRNILMVGNTAQNVIDARAGNEFDTFLFIPDYAALLLVLTLLIFSAVGARGRGLFYCVVIAICVTALCDWAENAGIERTLNHIAQLHEPQVGDAARISRPSIVKWSLVSVILLVLGTFAIGQRPWGGRVLGLLLLLPGAGVLVQLMLYFRELR